MPGTSFILQKQKTAGYLHNIHAHYLNNGHSLPGCFLLQLKEFTILYDY